MSRGDRPLRGSGPRLGAGRSRRRREWRTGKPPRRCRGEFRGPLHGIPIGIKDIVDVAGWPTEAGSPLRRGQIAQRDATLVAKLREAGAILLGKTVTTEFACFDPPPTRNPWNLQRTPGGSSSGSAAAVALGMCLGAVASQTGGSIIRPASYCGVAGYKPRFGHVSTDGVVGVSFHLDHPGPIAGCVADLATMFTEMRKGGSLRREVPIPTEELQEMLPPRLGLLDDFFLEKASPAIRSATLAAVEKLKAAGAKVVRAKLPAGFEEVHVMHRRIMAVEAAVSHRENFPAQRSSMAPRFGPCSTKGTPRRAFDYAAALRHQQQFRKAVRDIVRGSGALLMPATPTTAPGLETTGDPSFNSPWSYDGVAVVSIPCAVADDGLPVALQLVDPAFWLRDLSTIAQWCEEVLGFDARPPLLNG